MNNDETEGQTNESICDVLFQCNDGEIGAGAIVVFSLAAQLFAAQEGRYPTYGEVCEIVNAEWASAFGTSAALTAAHIMELSYPFGDDGTSGVER